MAKDIPEEIFRIIKISKESLFEFIYENMIDGQEEYMEVTDVTKIVSHFDVNWETGEFIFIARNKNKDKEHLQFSEEIDMQLLMSKLPDTIESMYSGEKRYIDFLLSDLIKIQNS